MFLATLIKAKSLNKTPEPIPAMNEKQNEMEKPNQLRKEQIETFKKENKTTNRKKMKYIKLYRPTQEATHFFFLFKSRKKNQLAEPGKGKVKGVSREKMKKKKKKKMRLIAELRVENE